MRPLVGGAAVVGVITGPFVFVVRRAREVARAAPELRDPALFVPFSVTHTSLRVLRAIASRPTTPLPGVVVTERLVAGKMNPQNDGSTEAPVRVFTYEPQDARREEGREADDLTGVLLWMHGGGRVAGAPQADHLMCSFLAREADVVVVSVDYRLAPEHPFPAGFNDICTVLQWLASDGVDVLHVDPLRIAVGGASAGGGLAAEASQWAVDADVPVAFQLLVYPMLDDCSVTPDPAGRGRLLWTHKSNFFGWTAYLGHPAGESETRPYAAAARRADLRGLPPAWIGVGDLDLFYAEDLDYAARLESAGVSCVVDVVPGMYHGADVMPRQSASMRAFWHRMAAALSRAVGSAAHQV